MRNRLKQSKAVANKLGTCKPNQFLSFFFDMCLCVCRLWFDPGTVSSLGWPWAHRSCGVRLPRPAGHPVRYCGLRHLSGYSGGQVLQPGALLHYPCGHLPGLLMYFLPHCEAQADLLLSPENWHRSLSGHELLSTRNQDQPHCKDPSRQQEEDLYQETQIHECLCSVSDCLHSHLYPAGHYRGPVYHGASGYNARLPKHSRGLLDL